MKLKKFTKNKKQKRIVIGSTVGILLLIGGISIYRTFAMYKVEKTFNVLEGTIPDFSNGDVTLALKVDGKSTDNIPTKGGNYAIQVDCDKGNGVWNMDSWGLEIKNIEKNKVKCNIEFTTLEENSSVFNLDYKGKEEAISLPIGKYKLEVWGAQGGYGGENINEKKQHGGLGGYSKGEIALSSNEILYINVGGQGESTTANTNFENPVTYKGGYNGGGDGLAISLIVAGFAGGGATHIAKVPGLLSQLEEHKEDNSILIVAGGGGGSAGDDWELGTEAYSAFGGSGGGYIGKTGLNSIYGVQNFCGSGATQNVGGHSIEKETEGQGSFGLGGNYYISYEAGAGGGGGYYGGGGSSRHHAGAGGGSGYIGNSLLTEKGMWCYQCDESEEDNTKTTSTDQVSEEATSEHAKQGNGFARITYLGNV